MATITIGGDICPTGRNKVPFQNGDAAGIFGDLLIEFENSDLSLVNLECPLISEKSPIQKSGPVLSAPEDCIRGIKNAHIDIVNLANNHIMDHGVSGLNNTLAVCAENGIDVVGAGKNLNEAQKILVRTIDGIRVGVLAVTEHEFSIASENRPGANPLDIIDCLRNIRKNNDIFDYLILLVHGGKELYSYPTPGLMKTCRFFAEECVDAIICQHSHCPVCYETYKGVPIAYGQGNLIFDNKSMCNDAWMEGFLVRLVIEKNCNSQMEIVPYVQLKKSYGVKKMPEKQQEGFVRTLEKRSLAIQDPKFVLEQWTEFCKRNKYNYLSLIQGYGRLRNFLNRKLHLSDIMFSSRSRRQVLNVIRCETHKEALETILELD